MSKFLQYQEATKQEHVDALMRSDVGSAEICHIPTGSARMQGIASFRLGVYRLVSLLGSPRTSCILAGTRLRSYI